MYIVNIIIKLNLQKLDTLSKNSGNFLALILILTLSSWFFEVLKVQNSVSGRVLRH